MESTFVPHFDDNNRDYSQKYHRSPCFHLTLPQKSIRLIAILDISISNLSSQSILVCYSLLLVEFPAVFGGPTGGNWKFFSSHLVYRPYVASVAGKAPVRHPFAKQSLRKCFMYNGDNRC